MEDIETWLNSIGLDKYVNIFAENEIDFDALPLLAEDDLKEIGVALGARRKILAAIHDLNAGISRQTDNSVSIDALDAGQKDQKAYPDPPLENIYEKNTAERRHLTVMFVDLVDSTAMSEQFDAEDMRNIITTYQNNVAEVIEKNNGYVARYMGDGVLCYFGWPKANEDDAVRAVHAAIEIVAKVKEATTNDNNAQSCRVGIATGVVIVGDLIGKGAAQEAAVVGETPNLAARLQNMAAPDQIAIADTTRRLLSELFVYEDMGRRDLKGFSGAVQAWLVLRESSAERQVEALNKYEVAPLIGRDEELRLLLSRWRRAKQGEGQVVLLSGEPGIGKSHITGALRHAISQEDHTEVRNFCSPFHANSSLYPVVVNLERAIGIKRKDTDGDKLEKLKIFLSHHEYNDQESPHLFANLLSINTEGTFPPLNLSPQLQRSRTLEVLVAEIEYLAKDHPLLIILENAHWIDPTTQEFFGILIEYLQSLPILLIVTFRPDFLSPWDGFPHITNLSLSRLGRDASMTMIRQVEGADSLPPDISRQILDKTDGVPLFVEEMTRAVLETAGSHSADLNSGGTTSFSTFVIPETLHDSLMARLDRLAPAKSVAQMGSVIGRDFSFELLSALNTMPEEALMEALDQLVASDLVFRRGHPPTASYRFKHALVQDVAYQSLLKPMRINLHARIALVLEKQFQHLAETEPEILARHFSEADNPEKAIKYWEQAGRRAAARSAYAEAIRQLNNGLEITQSLPDGEHRNERELSLLIKLGPALMALKGQAATEVGELYKRVFQVIKTAENDKDLFRALWGLWRYHFMRAEHTVSLDFAERCLTRLEEQKNDEFIPLARFALGGSLLWKGDFTTAETQFEIALSEYDIEKHGFLALEFGQDPSVSLLSYSAMARWFTGHPDDALERSTRALDMATALHHPATLAAVRAYDAMIHAYCRLWDEALERANRAIELSDEQGFPQHLAYARVIRGRALAEIGKFEEGIKEIELGISVRRSINAIISLPYYLVLYAESLTIAGHLERALEVLEEAETFTISTQEAMFRPEIFRVKGDILLKYNHSGAPDEAMACYRQALNDAAEQGARSLELRSATGMARVMATQGNFIDGHELLEPIYGWFKDKGDVEDLRDAKTVLDDLLEPSRW